MKLAEDLRSLALQGLHYFQTYDWLMLMSVIGLGYLGWMIYLVLYVLQSYTSLPGDLFRKEQTAYQRQDTRKVILQVIQVCYFLCNYEITHLKYTLWQVQVCGCLLMAVISILLLLERSPPLYHAYTAMTVFSWTQIFSEYRFIKALWKQLHGRRIYYMAKILATCAVSVFISEFLVLESNIQWIILHYVKV